MFLDNQQVNLPAFGTIDQKSDAGITRLWNVMLIRPAPGIVTTGGLPYTPNIPTEEIFTLPHREKVNGKVTQIDVVGSEANFRRLTEMVEGAAHLGEVALVPHSSPISQRGLVFHNILIDENAACHLASFHRGHPARSDTPIRRKGAPSLYGQRPILINFKVPVHHLHGLPYTILSTDFYTHFAGPLANAGAGDGMLNRLPQAPGVQLPAGDGFRPQSQVHHPLCPQELVGSHRHENGRYPGAQPGGCSARSTVMHHCRHARKQPVMRRGIEEDQV